MLRYLNGEIVLIAVFSCAIEAVVVDAHDVIDAAAVAGHADHGAIGRLRLRRRQQISQDRQPGPALKDKFLSTVIRKFANFERL